MKICGMLRRRLPHHEARTAATAPSFHTTAAQAMDRWSLARTIGELVARWLGSAPEFRRAVHPDFGRKRAGEIRPERRRELDEAVGDALACIAAEISAESVARHLGKKYRAHNARAEAMRTQLCREAAAAEHSLTVESRPVIGPTAARRVTLSSRVRAATAEEKASVPPPAATHGRGVTVNVSTR